MQAAPGTSSEMLSVLKAEHMADRVQTLGACEGMEGSEAASAQAFRALQDGQQGAGEAKVHIHQFNGLTLCQLTNIRSF